MGNMAIKGKKIKIDIWTNRIKVRMTVGGNLKCKHFKDIRKQRDLVDYNVFLKYF